MRKEKIEKAIKQRRFLHRQERIKHLKDKSKERERFEKKLKKNHASTLRALRELEKKEVMFSQNANEKFKQRKFKTYENITRDYHNSLITFNSNLSRTGVLSKMKQKKKQIEISQLKKKGKDLDVEKIKKESYYFLKELKKHKKEEKFAKRDREHRRRKIMIQQQSIFKEIEKNTLEEAMMERIVRQSNAERELEKKLSKTIKWKSVIKKNKEFRTKQLEQREKEMKEEKKRIAQQIETKYHKQFSEDIDQLMVAYEKKKEEKINEKSKENHQFCRSIVNGMLDITINDLIVKEISEGKSMDPQELGENKQLFFKSTETEPLDYLKNGEKECEELNAFEFENYTSHKRHWNIALKEEDFAEFKKPKEKGDVVILQGKENKYLYDALLHLHGLINSEENKESKLFHSKYGINGCILGKPFSISNFLYDHLKNDLGIIVIDPLQLIEKSTKERNELSQEIEDFLKSGEPVPEAVIAKVLANEIRRIESLEDPKLNGWMIKDFPKTEKGAKFLEIEISGYKEEEENKNKATSLIFDLETQRMEKEGKSEETNKEEEEEFGKHRIFNVVLFVELENKEIFNKICGNYVDPVTSMNYHLIQNPPPRSIISRIIADEDMEIKKLGVSENLLEETLENEKIMKYFKSRHIKVLEIDGNTKEKMQIDSMQKEVQEIIDEQRKTEEELAKKKEELENQQKVLDAQIEEEERKKLEDEEKKQSSTTGKGKKEKQKRKKEKKEELSSSVTVNTNQEYSISKENAKLLNSIWYSFEVPYVNRLKTVFLELRNQKKQFFFDLNTIKIELIEYLGIKDNKLEVVNSFIEEYNEIDTQNRHTEIVKNELHQRISELKQNLISLVTEKQGKFQQKIMELKEVKSLNYLKLNVSKLFQLLLHVETTRFIHSINFLKVYNSEKSEENKNKMNLTEKQLNLLFPNFFQPKSIDSLSGQDNNHSSSTTSISGKRKKTSKKTKEKTSRSDRNKDKTKDSSLKFAEHIVEFDLIFGKIREIIDKSLETDDNKKKKKSKTEEILSEFQNSLLIEKNNFIIQLLQIKKYFNSRIMLIDSFVDHLFSVFNEWTKDSERNELKWINEIEKKFRISVELEIPIQKDIQCTNQ